MTVAKLAQHAREIARTFNITLDESLPPGRRAGANPVLRVILCEPITTEEAYAVAMHEMGHILHPNGYVRGETRSSGPLQEHRFKLLEEDAAWEWARHYALDWSPTMEHIAQVTRSTYDTVYRQMENSPLYQVLEMLGAPHDTRPFVGPSPKPAPPTPKPATVKVGPVSDFAKTIKWGKGRG
jgi:hypothetical protein